MIDKSKITSGYDVELNLGCDIFGEIVRILFDAQEIPTSWTQGFMGYSLTLSIVPDYSVKFSHPASASQVIPEKLQGLPELDNSLVVYFGFNIELETPVGKFKIKDLDFGLLFGFKEFTGRNPDVKGIALTVHFWDLAGNWISKLPSEADPYREDIREILWDNLALEENTSFSGGTLQDLAVRVFNETDTHTYAVGLFFNLPFKAEPDGTRYPNRGNADLGQCLLPSKQHSIAVALNGAVYQMLATHLKNDFAEKDGDGYSYPLYSNPTYHAGYLGQLKNVGIWPRSYTYSFDMTDPGVGLSALTEPPNHPDLNAIYLTASARVKKMNVDADASIRVSITPTIRDNALGLEINVEDVEIDVDWEDLLTHAYGITIIFAFVGVMIGGPLGFVMGAMIGAGFSAIGEAVGIEILEDYVEDKIQDSVDPLAAPFKVVPRDVTIVTKRWDPFYRTLYNLQCGFASFNVNTDSLTASGFEGGRTQQDAPYPFIKIIGVTRASHGAIVDVIYEVEDAEEIVEPERCRQPQNALPGQFKLRIPEILTRIEDKQIRSTVYVTPTRVCIKDHQIAYIKFDSGLVLTPHEAGMLQVQNILGVIGAYDLVYMKHRKRYYFRTKPNIVTEDNLASLPRFQYSED